MKNLNLLIFILVIFLKTGNVLSENKLFNVNNIEIINKSSNNIEILSNQAIKEGYIKLIKRILLDENVDQMLNLQFSEIKELVSYYQIKNDEKEEIAEKKIFNISFDKDKLHNLFYQRGIAYSDITKNEIYLLPILKENDQFNIYSKNYFYDNWNLNNDIELVEFILPIENIEILQKINLFKDDILTLDVENIFPEYPNENIAIILIEKSKLKESKIFFKTRIMGKKTNKNLTIKNKENYNEEKFSLEIINNIKKQLVNLVKSQNLIDIRTPSFINTKFILNRDNNLVELNKRLEKIDLIENIYVQKFNNQHVLIKIKYLGKINKIIKELNNQGINLKLIGDQWSLKLI
tara:strand:- start:3494 stop:4540 length:1047 start_codon:yes stop_codon:yes gene_type:complete